MKKPFKEEKSKKRPPKKLPKKELPKLGRKTSRSWGLATRLEHRRIK